MQMLGEILVRLLGLPLPGPLVGLMLLLAALVVRGKTPKGLHDTTNHLLQHLMLLFIPPIAGVMQHFGRLSQEWLPFLVACIAGAAITIVVTALTFHWVLRRTNGPVS
jgi:putative effector of murein hydrolase LrgA (UPF0299 family)